MISFFFYESNTRIQVATLVLGHGYGRKQEKWDSKCFGDASKEHA